MDRLKLRNLTLRFIVADMKYVRLINLAMDRDHQEPDMISAEDRAAIDAAREKRNRLEAEMYAAWDTAKPAGLTHEEQ